MVRARCSGLLSLLLTAALVISACGGLGRSAWAQVQDDMDENEADTQVMQEFLLDESNFEMWVFGNITNGQHAFARLESQLTLKIEEIDRVCRLTEAQKQKLKLASLGDIKRFFDQVAEKRKAFELVRRDRQKFGAFYQQLVPLQQTFHKGLFDANSFFAKTIKKTLDERQAADYDALTAKRRQFQQQGRLGHLLATLDTNMALDRRQRQRLLKFIAEETRSPRESTAFDDYFILYQLAQLPEGRVKPYFRDPQWHVMRLLLAHSLSYKQRMIAQGVLPGESSTEPWIVPVDFNAPTSMPPDQESTDRPTGM